MLRGKCGVTSPRVMNFPEGGGKFYAHGIYTVQVFGSIGLWQRVNLNSLGKQGTDLIDLRRPLEEVIFDMDPFGGLRGCHGLCY